MTLTDGRIGQLLDGKYRLEELLARGGMGIVYAARHEATGRAVAVKILRAEFVTRPEFVRRVVAEARLAVDASHPNVVDVLDAGADRDGLPYLVLERLFGSTLESILTRPLPLLDAVQALVPIANAVCSLHRAGIVHRDIKPSNIFLGRDAQGRVTPKLLDFGIAKALEVAGSTLSGTALGTPAYMAPEQALGYRSLGPPTDVWAMGITLARCLTATLPFDTPADGPGSLSGGLDERAFRGVAPPVGRLLARALRFEPSERFADMSEFREALFSALRAVDASERWPDARTVSVGPDDTELSSYVATVSFEPTSPNEAAPVGRGRDLHVATRTLSNDARPKSWQRRFGWAAFAVLGLSASAGILAVLRSGRPVDASEPAVATPPAPNPPSLTRFEAAAIPDERAARPVEARGASSPPTTTPKEARGATPAARRAAARPVETTKAASEASEAPKNTVSEAEPRAEHRPAVGANRSPIIE